VKPYPKNRSTLACRHRTLVNYFGQNLKGTNCEACDVCQSLSKALAPLGCEVIRPKIAG
jgi:hypothetical protein